MEFHSADGVFVKEMRIPKAGTIVAQHSHSYDHTTMLAKGRMRVSVVGQHRTEGAVYQAPAGIFIPAKVMHMLESLEDDTIAYCIHRERDGGAAVEAEHHIEGLF